jgi:UDP-glucose 4-epimerase
MNILVTGGAGYIGSVICEYLSKEHNVVAFDSLSAGFKTLLKEPTIFVKGDILNKNALIKTFKTYHFDLVIHLAAKVVVSESVLKPDEYYQHNVEGTKTLIQVMHQFGVSNIIFASSAAVYGNPKQTPINENAPKIPINPYGKSKLAAEAIILHSHLRYVILRFFNVAGASKSLMCGMLKSNPTLLIPAVNHQILSGLVPIVYGDNYHTPDGTCIRDYVHVVDLAIACKRAIKLLACNRYGIFNLGSGKGYSVLNVIRCACKLNKVEYKHQVQPRRNGDPAILLTDNQAAKNILK